MNASQLKVNPWKNVTSDKKSAWQRWELRGTDINKCFGKVQNYNGAHHGSYTSIRAMISTEDPFTRQIPYTTDFKIINKVWEELMNELLNKIFK